MGNVGNCHWPTCDCENYEGHPCKMNQPDKYVEARLKAAGVQKEDTLRKAVELVERAREYARLRKETIAQITDPVMREWAMKDD